MSTILGHFPTLMVEAKNDHLQILMASEQEPREVLRGHLGQTIVPSGTYVKKKTDDTLIINWPDGNLRISHASYKGRRHRYEFYWTSTRPSKLLDTFDMTGGYWYGGAQVRKMLWPINKWNFKSAPFVAEDSYKDGEYGGVQERYWLSSNGVGIFIHQAVPLFVGINEDGSNLLRFQTKFESPYRNHTRAPLTLRYSICHGPDILSAHKLVMEQSIDRPIDIPDITMFRLPLWSTWAICKEDVDQNKVLSLANQIRSYNINTAQLQIDDDWAVHRGDWDFDRRKFPNPREMTRRLQEFGFRVTLWVHPFSNLKSKSIKKTDLFVKGQTRGATKWWNGIGRILDVTRPSAVEWYKKELSLLKENYALTSFKFDAGETNWLPKKWHLQRECNNPNIYTQKWAELAYELDKDWRAQEVRVGVRSQKLPIFVRMMDKDSSWSESNGLRSIIPTALLFGVIGYPFFIPDMVGGNAYDERPTKQLFIRWVQVCALMPCIQFSIPPWWFDAATVKLTKAMLALRAKYADLLVELAKEATKTGAPIIRPLWWIAPTDDFALKCDDQFLVGNDLLVAPVVTENAKKRPIYLPAGKWKDERSGKILDGRSWYFEYKVTLVDLPHFTRVKDDAVPTAHSEASAVEDIQVTPVVPAVPSDGSAQLDSTDATEPDLIKWDDDTEGLPVVESPTTPKQEESLLDLQPSQSLIDRKSILQPQPSVEDHLSTNVKEKVGSPSVMDDIKEFDELRVQDDTEKRYHESSDSDSDDEKSKQVTKPEETDEFSMDHSLDPDVPILEAVVEEAEEDPGALGGGNLLTLLRRAKSVSQDVDEGLEEAFSTLVSGKYRQSRLDEDLDGFDFLAELSDGSSLASYDMGEGDAPLARMDTYREESSSDDEDGNKRKIKRQSALPDLDSNIPADGSTKELDSPVPLPGVDVSTGRGDSLYENVHVPKPSDTDSQPAVPRRIEITKRRTLPDPEPRPLTLWDELTDKLKDRPKFDPEEEEMLENIRTGRATLGVQTSFDVLGKYSGESSGSDSESS